MKENAVAMDMEGTKRRRKMATTLGHMSVANKAATSPKRRRSVTLSTLPARVVPLLMFDSAFLFRHNVSLEGISGWDQLDLR